jgi:hypothetical protein
MLTPQQIQQSKQELKSVYLASSNFHFETFFINEYNTIPNKITSEKTDITLLMKLVKDHFGDGIRAPLFEEYYSHDKEADMSDSIYFPADHILIHCYRGTWVEFYYSPSALAENVELIKNFLLQADLKNVHKGKIYLLVVDDNYGNDMRLAEFKVADPKVDLSLHYNDDLIEVDALLRKKLNEEKGIVLLHGEPGTGKTTYIRHLIQTINRKVIYVPQDMAALFGKPDFLRFLMKHPGALLVIEDAESLLLERESSSTGAMANLLNMTDGLLSDCLKLQVICTFNIELAKIDKALLRKGRIIARYEFKKLSLKKTHALIHEMGKNVFTEKEMSIAEIFNIEETDFNFRNGSLIGFKN